MAGFAEDIDSFCIEVSNSIAAMNPPGREVLLQPPPEGAATVA